MIYGYILCLGDSITNGARDQFGRGYPLELWKAMWDKYKQPWICVNRGHNHWTSIDLARNAFEIARSYPECLEVVVQIGTNDSKPSIRTPQPTFEENVEYVIHTLMVLKRVIYLCTIPDFGGFGSTGYDRNSLNLIRGYNERLHSLHATYQTELVDLRDLDSTCYPDSVHVDNYGSKEIAKRVMAVISARRDFGESIGEKFVSI